MARERDTMEFLGMLRRMFAATAKRVGESDEFELAELLELEKDFHEKIRLAIMRQRELGKSWESIATATGTTRQAAQQRWGQR